MNDLTGLRVGKLTVLHLNGRTGKNNHLAWECLCDCGNKRTFDAGYIKVGNVRSCGCDKKIPSRTVILGDGTRRQLQVARTLAELETILALRSVDADRKYKTLCRVWIGSKNAGYGNLKFNGKSERTHRLSWMIHNGEISDELEICHHCDQPDCFRIDHLFIGTHLANMLDAAEKGIMGGPAGESHYAHKLTAEQVLELRAQFDAGIAPTYEMAASLGVCYNNLLKIKKRQSWKDI